MILVQAVFQNYCFHINNEFWCCAYEAIILLLTILFSERSNRHDLMIVAGGHKLLALGHQFLGRQTFYEMSFTKIHTIGAVTYNSLTGKYCILLSYWKMYESSNECSYITQRIYNAITKYSSFYWNSGNTMGLQIFSTLHKWAFHSLHNLWHFAINSGNYGLLAVLGLQNQ